ncbi:Multidrug resistance-associated protein 5 [Orobanche hederae]
MERNFYLLDCFARPFFCSLAAIEWLCLRMELLSTFVSAFCMVLLVSFARGSIDPMMDNEENTWIKLPKFSDDYISGVKGFIKNAVSRFAVGDEITCPCKKCKNDKWYRQDVIYDHLIYNGPSPLYMEWMCEVSRHRSDEDMDCEAGIDFGDTLGEG